jgi:large subunit ribosomal protein L10
LANATKEKVVKELNSKFLKSKAVVMANYSGVTANEMNDLRSKLRSEGVEVIVVKNTLARVASMGTQIEVAKEIFSGPVSIALSYTDEITPARVLVKCAKQLPKLEITGGVVEGNLLTADEVKVLSNLPGKEELLAKMLATMNTPATNFVGVLSGVIRKLLYVLKAIEEKK